MSIEDSSQSHLHRTQEQNTSALDC